MFEFFRTKKEIRKIEEEVKRSFENTKKDLSMVGTWIGHLDEKSKINSSQITQLKEQLNCALDDIEELKNVIALFGGRLSKHKQMAVYKQTAAVDVQTPVQTAVQTGILDNLTVSERSIILALLYSDMKLSYEDLAIMLAKDKSTIRGQINSIKQKSDGLIVEVRESNGKKRVFVPEDIAKLITKSVKVRVKKDKKVEDGV